MKLTKRQHQSETMPAERSEGGMDPWRQFASVQEAMERLFADRLWGPWELTERWTGQLSPKIDIQDQDDQFMIKADVPGVAEDQLKLEVTENMVCLAGRIEREEEEQEGKGMYRREREEGEFRREIFLPVAIDPETVQATVRHGLLTVLLKKQKREERKTVEIQKGY